MEEFGLNQHSPPTDAEFLRSLSIENADYLLACTHAVGKNRSEYHMKCCWIRKMKSGKIKVVVFGNRDWSGFDHVKNFRYVDKSRLSKLNL